MMTNTFVRGVMTTGSSRESSAASQFQSAMYVQMTRFLIENESEDSDGSCEFTASLSILFGERVSRNVILGAPPCFVEVNDGDDERYKSLTKTDDDIYFFLFVFCCCNKIISVEQVLYLYFSILVDWEGGTTRFCFRQGGANKQTKKKVSL